MKTATHQQSSEKMTFLLLLILFPVLLLIVSLVQRPQIYLQFAQTATGDHCSALAIASSSQFKANKGSACNAALKSIVLGQMKGPAGCVSDDEASAALDAACNLPDSEVPASACDGKVVASTPDFQANKAAACSAAGKSTVITQLTTDTTGAGEVSCPSQAEAEAALNAACGGTAAAGNPTTGVSDPNAVPSPATLSVLTPEPTTTAPSGTTGNALPSTTTGASGGGDIFQMLLAFIQQILQLLKSNGVI